MNHRPVFYFGALFVLGATSIGCTASENEEPPDLPQDTGPQPLEDTGTPLSYDPALSVQANLDNGVSVLEILAEQPVEALYGALYQGGHIFHVEPETGSGLVAYAIENSSPIHWNDFANQAPELGLGSEIGTGEPNTIAIVQALGEDSYAAQVAHDVLLNDYEDWFLPSIDELTAVYERLHVAELGNALAGNSYWSSTDEGTGAWVIYFANGNTYTPAKIHDHHHVLPVRAFN